MAEFEVEIVEVLRKKVVIEASSSDEAKDIINKKYADEEIVLDWSDFDEMSLNVNEVEDKKSKYPKSGIYEVFGNTVEYQEGEEDGYDVDSASYIPVDVIKSIGEFIDSF